MKEIRFKDWIFEVDNETTKLIYNKINIGGAESCGCSDCKNYLKQKNIAFPKEFKKLLNDLGIDYRKEAEVCHLYRRDDGYHQYNAWFHFIGKISKGIEFKKTENKIQELKFTEIKKDFGVLFREGCDLANENFMEYPLIQLEFTTSLPWVLNEGESE